MDLATIGLEAHSDSIVKATDDLDKLSGSAKRAEGAAEGLSGANRAAGDSVAAHAASTRQATGAIAAQTGAVKASAMAYKAQAKAARASAFQQKMLVFQLNDVFVSLASGMNPMMVAIQQGSQISQIYGPGEGGMGMAFKQTGRLMLGVLTKFPLVTAAVAALGIGFVGLHHEINATGDVTVGLGDVMLATLQVAADGIMTVLNPAIQAISPVFSYVWAAVTNSFKNFVNLMVGGFVGAYDAVLATWRNLPAAFADLGIQAAQGILDALASMARGAAGIFNDMMLGIQSQLRKIGTYIDVPTIDAGIYAPQLGNQFAGAASGVAGAASKAFQNALGTDYAGKVFDQIAEKARNMAKEAEKAGKKAGSAAKKATDPWKGLRGEVDKTAQAMAEKMAGAMRSIGSAIAGVINGTKTWKDVLGEVVNQLIQALFSAQSLKTVFGGGGVGGLLSGIFGGLFANGGVFDRGGVTPFARGGVVSRPTLFPFAGGTGVMGEAGPEAIMPLKRGSGGKLGVAANQNPVPIHVIVTADRDGLNAYVKDTADGQVKQAAPAIVQGAVGQVNKQMPGMIQNAQKRAL